MSSVTLCIYEDTDVFKIFRKYRKYISLRSNNECNILLNEGIEVTDFIHKYKPIIPKGAVFWKMNEETRKIRRNKHWIIIDEKQPWSKKFKNYITYGLCCV